MKNLNQGGKNISFIPTTLTDLYKPVLQLDSMTPGQQVFLRFSLENISGIQIYSQPKPEFVTKGNTGVDLFPEIGIDTEST